MAEPTSPLEKFAPWVAARNALRLMIAIGRRDLVEHGAVRSDTWEAIDELTDELVRAAAAAERVPR